jgi:hypothetical protein
MPTELARELRAALEIRQQLVRQLPITPRSKWPRLVQAFFERLRSVGVRDRAVRATVVALTAEDLRERVGGPPIGSILDEVFEADDETLEAVLKDLEGRMILMAGLPLVPPPSKPAAPSRPPRSASRK